MGLVSGWLTVVLLYAMGAVPFAVWAGSSVYTAVTVRSGYPGHAPTFWLVGAPAALMIYGWLRGFDTSAEPFVADQWGQVLYLMMAPCVGMISGYALGWLLAVIRKT